MNPDTAVNEADPLHDVSGPDTVWSTVNTAEALPGVLTPLGATFFAAAADGALRQMFHDVGVMTADEVAVPPSVDEHFQGTFYGRSAANLSMFRNIAERTPGQSAEAFEQQVFGGLHTSSDRAAVRRRHAAIAARMPPNVVRLGPRLRGLHREIDVWWRSTVGVGRLGAGEALDAFVESRARLQAALRRHSLASLLAQALYERVASLAARAGLEGLENRLTSSDGDLSETAISVDAWQVATGLLPIETFLDRHGYHGPREGEISSIVWREDPSALDATLAALGTMDASESPAARERRQRTERDAATAQLLAALPRRYRAVAPLVLRASRSGMVQRELGKAAFLRAIDVGRAAARRLGEEWAGRGLLDDAGDVFYLTADEVQRADLDRVAELVPFRRRKREEYLRLALPEWWQGNPEPVRLGDPRTAGAGPSRGVVRGTGVSSGVAEGTARVVRDPATAGLAPGDILVCHTTDPSWVTLFALAGAVVTDVGGTMSHGAIVARELGIPCVVNTRTATFDLPPGAYVRVDGGTGEVTWR